MTYEIQLRPRAARQLRALPRNVRTTIARVIESLAENPRPAGAVQLRGTDLLRVRVRDYRVVYEVRDDALLVLVVRVGHRRDLYQALTRGLAWATREFDRASVRGVESSSCPPVLPRGAALPGSMPLVPARREP